MQQHSKNRILLIILKTRGVFMKNTKISLISGLMLTITLFTSVQISSMERQPNRFLDRVERDRLAESMQKDEGRLKNLRNLVNKNEATHRAINAIENHLQKLQTMYYGTKPYEYTKMTKAMDDSDINDLYQMALQRQ
jgi:hypothetical protein